MGQISTLAGVIGLWVGVSVSLWGAQRLRKWFKRRRERALAAEASRIVDEIQAIFDNARSGLFTDAARSEGVRAAAARMARRLAEQSPHFDRAATLSSEIRLCFKTEEHPGLAETLQIRRDLWAAAEALQARDWREMAGAFADESAFEASRTDAIALAFKKTPGGGEKQEDHPDPIDARLSSAREATANFSKALEDRIEADQERERLPTTAEILAPLRVAARGVSRLWRRARLWSLRARSQSRKMARHVQSGTVALRRRVQALTERHRTPFP